jgi:glycosyltransferase involved in cell wall biosynthesis
MIRVAILADMPVKALESRASGRGGGDAATWLPQLAQAFAKEVDLEIHWIVLTKQVTEVTSSNILGQKFYQIPKGAMTLDILTGHVFARRKLNRVLKTICPDVIHVWGSESSYPSVLEGASVPTVMSMQGILTEYVRIGSFRRNWRIHLQSRYERGWVRAATVVTSESKWGLDKVREMAPDVDGRLVEYGVNPSFYDLSWNPNPSHPVILYCGGTDWRKGFDLLFGALTISPAPRWTCWIAGGGSIPPGQKGMLPAGTELLGNLNWSQLQDRMSQAWALILPTRADTSPNAVKEARVTGMPVITSRHGGQSGYIRDGENGMIVDPLTPEGLRKAIDALLSDFSLTKTMGAARHAEDRDYFRPERTAEGFTVIYRELAKKER